ncbi:Cyclin-D2-2 [Dichanthelium oligosanthes]|uniref:Cyclin-D2-2 n=1 Tax=Dichanthelium oligosanthes TaxID=888268 RepID=A0A1E5W7V4_9POAL|nr:Cyclin-D2-2 [Dichanthelium oligosanthes]
MGVLCFGASSTLLCGEDRNSILDLCGGDELVEVGSGLDFSDAAGAVFPVDTDEAVRALVEKETDHLPLEGYAERLEHGGLESSWRRDAMDWICKVHSYYNFGPLSLYLAVNYLDRFLSSYNLPHDKPWMKQLLSVACLSVAVKMEETVVPLPVDLQVCDAKFVFEARTIGRMELLVLTTLKWRMQAVTPFAFISYFLDKFSEGKPPSFALASRCAEIVVGTLKGSTFLAFRPSEIAGAAALAVVSVNQVVGFGSVLSASEIPVNKEMITRCYELMQERALVKKRGHNNGSPSVPQSPIGVLDAACFSFRSEDATLGSSQSNISSNNNNQASTPASKRRRLSISPI